MTQNPGPLFNRVAGYCSVLSLLVTFGQLVEGVGSHTSGWAAFPLGDRLNILLHLSIITAVCEGVLWTGIEKTFDWNYGPGPVTPVGIPAATLSLPLTIPAILVPVLYEDLVAKHILPPSHWHGAILALFGGAIAHLVVFGTDSSVYSGLRQIVLRRFDVESLKGELLATLVYAFVMVGLIAVPYRLATAPNSPVVSALGQPILASLLVFFGVSGYILLKFPESLHSPVWVHTRGIIAGIFMAVAICVGMYW